MKILEHCDQMKWQKELTCQNCDSKLLVEDTDLFVKTDSHPSSRIRFKCPVCEKLMPLLFYRDDFNHTLTIPKWLENRLKDRPIVAKQKEWVHYNQDNFWEECCKRGISLTPNMPQDHHYVVAKHPTNYDPSDWGSPTYIFLDKDTAVKAVQAYITHGSLTYFFQVYDSQIHKLLLQGNRNL